MKVSKILMPTDFSACANSALSHALFLAELFDAELHLLHVVVLHDEDPFEPAHHFPDTEDLFRRLREIASSELASLIARRSLDRLDLYEKTVRGISPAAEIVSYADQNGVDLVVMGRHGRRGLRRFLLGSVTEEVIRIAACPVLTVRAGGDDRIHAVSDIVVPYDFSALAPRALEIGKGMATAYGCHLHVVHAIEPPMDIGVYDLVHDPQLSFHLSKLVPEVDAHLGRLVAAAAGDDVAVTSTVREGRPAAVIDAYAEGLEAPVLVMTTHGRSGLEHAVLGSVTEKVVRTTDAPVLTLRLADDASG